MQRKHQTPPTPPLGGDTMDYDSVDYDRMDYEPESGPNSVIKISSITWQRFKLDSATQVKLFRMLKIGPWEQGQPGKHRHTLHCNRLVELNIELATAQQNMKEI